MLFLIAHNNLLRVLATIFVFFLAAPLSSFAQSTLPVSNPSAEKIVRVSGKVLLLKEGKKAGLALARVQILGTDIKALTNPEGYFSVEVPQSENAVDLKVHYLTIGEQTLKLIPLTDKTQLEFVLIKHPNYSRSPCGDRPLRRE